MENLKLNNVQACQYCGKPYKETTFKIINQVKKVLVPSCNCFAEFEAKKEFKKRLANKRQFLSTYFENSLFAPAFKDLDFDFIDNSENKTFSLNFVKSFSTKKSKGFYFIGDVGRGKTTMCACIAKELYKKDFTPLIIKVSTLLDVLLDTIKFDNKLTTERLLNIIVQYDFIVLDDFASEAYNDRRIDMLRRLIDHLVIYKKCIAFTCNPQKIFELKQNSYKYHSDFKAIFDRLSALCPYSLEFRGESFRRNIGA